MKRLYQKIYLTMLASLLVVVLVATAFWRIGAHNSPAAQAFDIASELAGAALPPASAPRAEQQEALERFAARLDIDLALYDRTLAPIAAAGGPPRPSRSPPPPPPSSGDSFGMNYGPGGPVWSSVLPDERRLVVRPHVPPRHPAFGLVAFIGSIALVVGLCAFPVVRGLTRRLERLQTGVETLGSGNLATRVKVEGRDEVARLAESFNRAAVRIEDLVGAHRMLLANASHELRTPLSRIRLGLELYQADGDPKYRDALTRDIAELDGLIDEILLASRLDALRAPQAQEEVDLLALAAEEGARYEDCNVEGEAVTVRGDPRLLRRLIRNLLENAARHGRPPVQVVLRRVGGRASLDVSDAGAGIPAGQRERVFEPFAQLGGNAGGAGLGLSLVRQIARLHGGDAMVADDAASRLRVTLPISGSGPTSR